jgi:hypothetical protein
MYCNGDTIPEPSPWAGQNTPNLNNNGLFLRGSNPEDILSFQDDAFEDHSHVIVDPGHSHIDTGHTHNYEDCGEVYHVHVVNVDGIGTSPVHENLCREKTTQTSNAQITTDKTRITISSAKEGKSGAETRPKNMAVQWIIRVF